MSYNFLIVDDSITMRALMKRTIRVADLAAEFYEASDGLEALELLEHCKVDLILADLKNDAQMDGVELIGRLLAEPDTRSVPVVVVSARPDMKQIRRLVTAGAKGFLPKPFTVEALRDVIARILEPTHV